MYSLYTTCLHEIYQMCCQLTHRPGAVHYTQTFRTAAQVAYIMASHLKACCVNNNILSWHLEKKPCLELSLTTKQKSNKNKQKQKQAK